MHGIKATLDLPLFSFKSKLKFILINVYTCLHTFFTYIFFLCDLQGRRQAPAAMVSGCRSIRHNGEELLHGSAWKGRTIEPQCSRGSRGHDKPICQPGRAVLATVAPDPLLTHTMKSERSRAEGNGGEFPARYNKMESSILVTEERGQSQATPRIRHIFERLQRNHLSGSVCSWRPSIHGSVVHPLGPLLVTFAKKLKSLLPWLSDLVTLNAGNDI